MLLENETMTLILGGCEITVQATLSAAVCHDYVTCCYDRL